MGKMSREKGKRGEREFTGLFPDGERTWWAPHDVTAGGRPWEIKLLANGLSVAYAALEEFKEHEAAEGNPQFRPVVAARMDRKPWIVIQYLDDWRAENETQSPFL